MAQGLPCLESRQSCLAQLTGLAIEQSAEIEALEARLQMAAERIDYTEARQWTDYLTLDPLRLVQNLLGGGDVQRNRLAIVELEVRLAELVSRREAVATALTQQVVERVLTYEQLGRQLELLEGQLQTQRQQVAVMEAAYRLGQGSTLNMLSLWQRTEELEAQRAEVEIQRARGVVELEQLVGVD